MTSSSKSLKDVMDGYAATRDALTSMVTELRAVVENAKKEASLTQDVLVRIEGSATKLAVAQETADAYLAGITRILKETHETYAAALNTTLSGVNQQVVDNLSTAIGLLHSTIEELGNAVRPAGGG